MNNKPTYKDYKKQRKNIFKEEAPIISGDSAYTLGDRRLVEIIYFLALFFPVSLFSISNPYYPLHTYWWIYAIGVIILPIAFPLIFWRNIVFRFGWFHAVPCVPSSQTDDSAKHDDFNEYKDIDTGDKRRQSRLFFVAFLTALVSFSLLFYFSSVSHAYQRIYDDHKQELDQLTRIAQDYHHINVDGFRPEPQWINGSTSEVDSGTSMSQEDAAALRTISASLNGHYVKSIYGGKNHLTIWMAGGFSIKRLEWYRDEVTYEEVISRSYDKKAVQLDDHWWCVW